jgi:hypothetical protein
MFPKRRAIVHPNVINIYCIYRITQIKKFHSISHRALVMVFFIFLQQTVLNAQSILAMLGTSTNGAVMLVIFGLLTVLIGVLSFIPEATLRTWL